MVPDSVTAGPSQVLPPEELGRLFEDFSRATVELQGAHDALLEQVQSLKDELEAKNQRLERKKRLEALGSVAAGVAHEFRNPLGGVRLTVDALLGSCESEKEQSRLHRISRAVTHLDRIVEDLLTFARNDGLQKTLEPAHELVSAAVEMVFPAETRSPLNLVTGGPTELRVSVDRHTFIRVLVNLFLNAQQALTDPKGRVGVWWGRLDEDQVWFEVGDEGCGIPEHAHEQIFHPFYSLREGGTGLGLAIVHDRVEAHDGEISLVGDALGGGDDWPGARFRIVLPQQGEKED